MVCRQDKLASVTMALVKRDVGLDDAQVQSLMHQLRHEGVGQLEDPLHFELAQQMLRTRLQAEIAADPTVRPQRRQGLLQRLEQASTVGSEPSTVHAAGQLRGRAYLAEQQLGLVLRELASRNDTSVQQTREHFDRLRAAAPAGRKPRASSDERLQLAGLPHDPATRHALEQLAAAGEYARPVVTDWAVLPDRVWLRAGHDSDSGRLEVIDAAGRSWAFRAVPVGLVEQLQEPQGSQAAREQISSDPAFRYRTAAAAAQAGLAVRCERCGQFVGDPHTCPADRVTRLASPLVVLHGTDGTLWGRLTDPALVGDALRLQQTVQVQVLSRIPGYAGWAVSTGADPAGVGDAGAGTVRGGLIVATDDGVVQVRASELACDCPTFRRLGWCRHVAVTQRLVLAQLPGAGDRAEPADLHVHRPAAIGPQPLPPDLSTVSFSRDPQAFADAVRTTLARAEQDPDTAVPLILDQPALYGYGADRRFGVEVEYVVDHDLVDGYGSHPADHRLHLTTIAEEVYVRGQVEEQEYDPVKNAYVLRRVEGWVPQQIEVPSMDGEEPLEAHQLATHRIGRALYSDGLLDDPAQQQKGAAGEQGYISSAWSLERDDSVSGELVSPILHDDPEDWAQLQQVCQAVRADGGTTSQASAHVHVSAPDYARDVGSCASRLLSLVAEYEDDLHRMAHNPTADRELGLWAAPNPAAPSLGFLDRTELRATNPRSSTINFGGVHELDQDPDSSHLEFRLFDASLQPGRMQAQVKLATALTDYAARYRNSPQGPRRPVGTALQQTKDSAVGGLSDPDQVDADTWARQTAGVRECIDRLFRRDIDKQQIAALWAVGRYRQTP